MNRTSQPVPRRSRTRLLAFVILTGLVWTSLASVAAPATAAADRPAAAELLPENTLAFVQFANVPTLVERFRKTATGRMAQDEQLKPLLGQFWQLAVDYYRRVETEINTPLNELLAVPQGEICLALVAAENGPPQLVAWIDCGDNLRTVHKLLKRGEEELANRGIARSMEVVGDLELVKYDFMGPRQRSLVYCIKDQTLLVTSHAELAKQVLAQWSGQSEGEMVTFAENRKFTAIMNRCRGQQDDPPQVTWFVDPIELARRAGRGNFSAQTGLAIISGLGLDGVKGVGGSLTFATDEFDGLMHSHLLLDAPRKGVVDALAMQTGDLTPEPWVPVDVESYMALNWDVAKTYGEIVRLFELFRGGEGQWEMQVLAPVSDRTGLDLERDLVQAMSGRITLVTWMQKPARLNSQSTLLGLKLKDAAATRKVIEKLAERFPERMTRKSYGGVTYYESPLPRAPRPQDQNEELMRPELGCLAVMDDYLLLTNNDKLLQQAIVTKSDPSRNLSTELDFKLIVSKIQRQLGDTQAGMISFNRPEEGMRQLYDLATSETMRARLRAQGENNAFFRGVDGALNASTIPPFAVLAQYLAPGGALITNDETGFHYLGFALRREP